MLFYVWYFGVFFWTHASIWNVMNGQPFEQWLVIFYRIIYFQMLRAWQQLFQHYTVSQCRFEWIRSARIHFIVVVIGVYMCVCELLTKTNAKWQRRRAVFERGLSTGFFFGGYPSKEMHRQQHNNNDDDAYNSKQ